MIKKQEQKDGLSITSLVLSIVGAVLCLTIIGAILGIPAAIAGLVFGIVALVKKQKQGMAIAGVIISSMIVIISIVMVVVGVVFVRKNADILTAPLKEFSQMIEQNPELEELMQNPEFANEFEYEFKNKILENFGEETELESREEVKTQIPGIFEEMKNLMLELKEKHQD